MAGRSILYLGCSELAADFCANIKSSGSCGQLTQSNDLSIPDDAPDKIDLVMFEVGPGISHSGQSLAALISTLSGYPLIAVTSNAHEHRGNVCADTITEQELEMVIDHAIQRHRLLMRLSETDSTVLSILKSINDGVIVVDRHGHVLDINPAARSILDLSPRQQTDADWARAFCSITADGESTVGHDQLPLVKACRGQKFANQLAVYRLANQADTVLSINGQGLYDGNRSLVGGVITFRDTTDAVRRARWSVA